MTDQDRLDPQVDEDMQIERVEGLSDFHSNEYSKKTTYFFISFFIIGLINNNGYVLINSAAQDLAKKFDKKELMGSFQLSLIIFSSVIRVVNTKYLLRFKHKSKIFWVICAWSLSYAMLFITYRIKDNNLGFTISILGTIIMGVHTSIGGGTTLGFMKALPPNVIGGYASGTGFAGISGSGITLVAGLIGISFDWVCLGLIPLSFVFLVMFNGVVDYKVSVDKKYKEVHGDDGEVLKSELDNAIPTLDGDGVAYPTEIEENFEEREAKINQELSMEIVKKSFKYVGFAMFNLAAVYFLEYMCTTSFAERANPKDEDPNHNFIQRQAYKILAFSYQIGVFISRSSFQFFKFENVGLLTVLQAINFLIFFSVAYWKWLSIYYQIPLMIWVGLMGGCSYVNCIYLILSNKYLKKGDKEVVINVAVILCDIGIFFASMLALVVSIWIIKD